MKKKIFIAILCIVIPTLTLANFTIEDYKYYRNIEPGIDKSGSFVINIDEKIYKKSNDFLSDLKIVNSEYKEIPFRLIKEKNFSKDERIEEKVIVLKKDNTNNKNTFILDLGESNIYHKNIFIKSKSIDFRKFFYVYGSNDVDKNFENLNLNRESGDAVYHSPEEQNFFVNYKYNNYRYLKLVFYGDQGNLIVDDFFSVKIKTTFTKGDEKIYKLRILEKTEEDNKTKILLSVPFEKIPLDYLIIKTKEKEFVRPVVVYSSNNKDSKILKNKHNLKKYESYWKEIYNQNFEQNIYDPTKQIKINDNKKYYLLVIDNKDIEKTDEIKNKPLNILEILGIHFNQKIFIRDLDFNLNSYRLYYGNTKIINRHQDNSVSNEGEFKKSVLSFEYENKLFLEKKKSSIIYHDNFVSYLFGFLGVIFTIWIVYKVTRERKNKDIDDNPYIDRL